MEVSGIDKADAAGYVRGHGSACRMGGSLDGGVRLA